MMFIKLNTPIGRMTINADMLVAVHEVENKTFVEVRGGAPMEVLETYDDIMAMIG
jgi:hypothetical protein